MRGKNIIWLTLIAVLISVSLVNLGYTQDDLPTLTLSPETIKNEDMSISFFSLEVTLTNVERLWAYGFTLEFAKFAPTVNPIIVIEDPEFREYSPPQPNPDAKTWFVYNVDTTMGILSVGCTRMHDFFEYPDGFTGSLRLCTIMVAVVNAGDDVLRLTGTEILRREPDPDPTKDWMYIPMDHNVIGECDYIGPNAKMLRPHGKIADSKVNVGDEQVMRMRVVNDSPVPLYVKVRFVIQREDGEAAYLYSGQTFTGLGPQAIEYLYVDGYSPSTPDGAETIPWAGSGWDFAGPPECLIGQPDGVYIESNTHCQEAGFWSFEDIDLGGRIVEDVEFEAYSQCQYIDADIDSEIFAYDELGDPYVEWAWGNSQGGTTTWDWTNKRYYYPAYNFPEYYGYPLTEQAIDTTVMALHNYAGGTMQIDAYRMALYMSKYAPVDEPLYYLLPGEEIELTASWFMSSFDVGNYKCEATLFYNAHPPPAEFFVRAHNPPAFTFCFQCLP